MDPLEPVAIGTTGVTVTRLGFGSSGIGGWPVAVDEASAARVLDVALDAGIRYIDTAPMYGHGLSEERVGAFVRRRGEPVVVSTKVGRLLREVPLTADHGYGPGRPMFVGEHRLNPTFDFSYAGIVTSLDESSRRSGLDGFDIALLHDPDDHMELAMGEGMRALRDLRAAGRIRAIGAGMRHVAPLTRLVRDTDIDCVLEAGRYTLLDQSALDGLLPAAADRGVTVLAAGVFNSGLLADPHDAATFEYRPAPPELLARARRIAEVCARHDVPLAAAAVQFPLGHSAVGCVVVGMRDVTEVATNLHHLRLPIPEALWADLKTDGLLREEAPVPRR
jgi:D-threo-aldose 1-dehydrogenase